MLWQPSLLQILSIFISVCSQMLAIYLLLKLIIVKGADEDETGGKLVGAPGRARLAEFGPLNQLCLDFGRWSKHKRLRLASIVTFLVSNVAHLIDTVAFWMIFPLNTYTVITSVPNTSYSSAQLLIMMRTGSLLYNCCFAACELILILLVVDRFQRVTMVLPGSRKALILRLLSSSCVFMCILIVIGNVASFIRLTSDSMFANEDDSIDSTVNKKDTLKFVYQAFKSIVQLLEIVLAFTAIFSDLYFNLSLVLSSLRSYSISTNHQSYSNRANNITARYQRTHFKMIFLYTASMFLDFSTVLLLILATPMFPLPAGYDSISGVASFLPSYETLLIVSSIPALHYLFTFNLLDMFLEDLRQIKKTKKQMPPVESIQFQNDNATGTSRMDHKSSSIAETDDVTSARDVLNAVLPTTLSF